MRREQHLTQTNRSSELDSLHTPNSGEYQSLIAENTELREDNKVLVQENDNLKEELEEKDNIIDDLNEQIQNLSINLKEWEIRLSHTTELYLREKSEREDASIAFNRILNNFTNDENNSNKFLNQNMQLAQRKSAVFKNRHCSQDYSTNYIAYPTAEGTYDDKGSMGSRRDSDSRVNTSCINANQRTIYTNGSHTATGGGETTSTGLLNNNESYDFNPKDMEEMASMHYAFK